MKKIKVINCLLVVLISLMSSPVFAADSYRWLHVTIDTPWAIFIFLLPMVLIPVILMAILYWRFAFSKSAAENEQDASVEAVEKK